MREQQNLYLGTSQRDYVLREWQFLESWAGLGCPVWEWAGPENRHGQNGHKAGGMCFWGRGGVIAELNKVSSQVLDNSIPTVELGGMSPP